MLLHRVFFTNVQLDDFQLTVARFIERLEIEGAEECEWIMMAAVNICAVLEYGKPTGVLKKAGGVGTRDMCGASAVAIRVMAKRGLAEDDKDKKDVDEESMQQTSPAMSEAEPAATEGPAPFRFGLQLLFASASRRRLRAQT